MATILARGTLLYLTTVNVGTAALFAYDKHQASQRAHRVSERRLCNTALLGGWPGGLLAMQLFRHKTRKTSFQRKYVGAIGSNTIVVLPAVLLLAAFPPLRAAFANDIARLLGRRPPPSRRWGGGRTPPRWRR